MHENFQAFGSSKTVSAVALQKRVDVLLGRREKAAKAVGTELAIFNWQS